MILIDNNLYYKLKFFFENKGIYAEHVGNCGLEKSLDLDIWKYARDCKFCILSKDTDFVNLYNIMGYPPKIIIISCGNRNTKEIENLLDYHWMEITNLINDEEIGIIEVS